MKNPKSFPIVDLERMPAKYALNRGQVAVDLSNLRDRLGSYEAVLADMEARDPMAMAAMALEADIALLDARLRSLRTPVPAADAVNAVFDAAEAVEGCKLWPAHALAEALDGLGAACAGLPRMERGLLSTAVELCGQDLRLYVWTKQVRGLLEERLAAGSAAGKEGGTGE